MSRVGSRRRRSYDVLYDSLVGRWYPDASDVGDAAVNFGARDWSRATRRADMEARIANITLVADELYGVADMRNRFTWGRSAICRSRTTRPA